MRNCFFVLFALAVVPVLCKAQVSDKNAIIYPLNIEPSLSATFGELRDDHFHSGLDLKTGGTTGKEVRSAAEGYIYRISISPSGYGNAIYIRHPGGYSTLYGHLDHFRKDIADYVRSNQYEQKSFAINLYPSRDKFRVKAGELIAWSGNSGGSLGPHLHFEVRESSDESPVNPLLFNLGITDRVKPVIEKIVIYPATRYASVNNSHLPLTLKVTGAKGVYSVAPGQVINVNGLTGFGVKTYDLFDNSSNHCGVYKITMEVDSAKIYCFTCNRFSYTESRYINSHTDYGRRIENHEFINRLWLEPGNKLSMYNNVVDRGLVNFSDGRIHSVTVSVYDANGNKSSVNFKVKALASAPIKAREIQCYKVIPYGRSEDFDTESIKIHFPSDALYDTLYFRYGFKPGGPGYYSGIHQVHKESVAVNDVIRISIKPDSIPHGLESKLYLAKIDNTGRGRYMGGEMRFGYVSAEVRSFGRYAVCIDTLPPSVRPTFERGADLSGRSAIMVIISDDRTGIRSYEGSVDGNWVLFEYDAKRSLLTFHPDETTIKKGTTHKLEMTVTDNRGNTKILKTSFTW